MGVDVAQPLGRPVEIYPPILLKNSLSCFSLFLIYRVLYLARVSRPVPDTYCLMFDTSQYLFHIVSVQRVSIPVALASSEYTNQYEPQKPQAERPAMG